MKPGRLQDRLTNNLYLVGVDRTTPALLTLPRGAYRVTIAPGHSFPFQNSTVFVQNQSAVDINNFLDPYLSPGTSQQTQGRTINSGESIRIIIEDSAEQVRVNSLGGSTSIVLFERTGDCE